MKARELLIEFYDPANDELSQADYDDTRRPRLTLSSLSKMRKSRDAERIENQQYVEFLPSMYSTSEEI